VHSMVNSVQQKIEHVASARTGFLEGASLGKIAVAALGLSGPLTAAVVLATGLAGRRLKRAVHSKSQTSSDRLLAGYPLGGSPLPASSHVAVDSPPPPQRTVPETHYVPIEKDSFAKAHQWASEHVARKYPGATEVLQALDSLIKQFLAAK
jgi:hypothetical protein